LLKEGESENVDFKIDCKAFSEESNKKHLGELAKDICAMANNRNKRKNYIIIGVSDDREKFKSFENPNFTDDRLQDFCKKVIFPIPKVKFRRIKFAKGNPEIINKVFGIIEIKPTEKTAYRITRDFIDYENKICIRRNDVWIRRGATSDLATPEEIERLLAGKSAFESNIENDIEYQLLPKRKQAQSLLVDFTNLVKAMNGEIFSLRIPVFSHHRDDSDEKTFVALKINETLFVLGVIIIDSLRTKNSWVSSVNYYWTYEHGLIFLLFDGVREYAFQGGIIPNGMLYHIKKEWGILTIVETNIKERILIPTFTKSRVPLPKNLKDSTIFTLVIKDIKKTSDLHRKFRQATDFIERSQVFEDLKKGRENLVKELKTWLRKNDGRDYYWFQEVKPRENEKVYLRKFKILARKIIERSMAE